MHADLSVKLLLGISIVLREIWNRKLIKLPGTVIPGRARQKFEVRARRGTVNFFTKKRAGHDP